MMGLVVSSSLIFSMASASTSPHHQPAMMRLVVSSSLILSMASASTSPPPPPTVDIAFCIIGQERSFTSPVVYDSLRSNVFGALLDDAAAWRGDTFFFIKVEKGGNVSAVRRTARKLKAVSVDVVRRAEDYDRARSTSLAFAAPATCPFRSGPRTTHGPVDYMRRKFALVSDDQTACFSLVAAHERERGRRYTHVMKLRADMQVCSPLSPRALAAVLLRHTMRRQWLSDGGGGGGGSGGGDTADEDAAVEAALEAMTPAAQRRLVAESATVIKQRDHWAFMPRAERRSSGVGVGGGGGGGSLLAPPLYFSASGEVLGPPCVGRGEYDRFGPHRCHWPSRTHAHDVPNECLLDHWLWRGGVDFAEVLVPTCIRKTRLTRPEPCPAVSFNRNWRLNTSTCYSKKNSAAARPASRGGGGGGGGRVNKQQLQLRAVQQRQPQQPQPQPQQQWQRQQHGNAGSRRHHKSSGADEGGATNEVDWMSLEERTMKRRIRRARVSATQSTVSEYKQAHTGHGSSLISPAFAALV